MKNIKNGFNKSTYNDDFTVETALDQSKNISAFLSTVTAAFSNPSSNTDMGVSDWEGLSAILSNHSAKIEIAQDSYYRQISENKHANCTCEQIQLLKQCLSKATSKHTENSEI